MGATVDPNPKRPGLPQLSGGQERKTMAIHPPVRRSGVRVVIVARKPGNSGGAKGHSKRDS